MSSFCHFFPLALLGGLRSGSIEINGVFPDPRLRRAPKTETFRIDLLFSHLAKLEAGGYVAVTKESSSGKDHIPCFRLRKAGERRLYNIFPNETVF